MQLTWFSAKTGKDPSGSLFDAAMPNVMPLLEVRARRVGGAKLPITLFEVRADRKTTLGIRSAGKATSSAW